MLKKIIILVLVLSAIAAIAVFNIYNKSHVNVSTSKADVSLLYSRLIDEFETDENSANIKYLDQIVEVTGPIAKIEIERGKTIITIGKEELFGNVNCHMSFEEENQFKNLKVGQNITLRGICTGYLMNVILVRSVLTN